jgi:hypothetical protein
MMIASLAVVGLYWFEPFRAAMKDTFLRWPILALVISTSGLATYPLEYAWKALRARREKNKAREKYIARLNDLTPYEKHVLARYLENESTTENWERGGGTVDTLARDGILILLYSSPDNVITYTPDTYAINEVAWKHLNAHPELIGLRRPRPVTPPPA